MELNLKAKGLVALREKQKEILEKMSEIEKDIRTFEKLCYDLHIEICDVEECTSDTD